jgi:hypothetical protein
VFKSFPSKYVHSSHDATMTEGEFVNRLEVFLNTIYDRESWRPLWIQLNKPAWIRLPRNGFFIS